MPDVVPCDLSAGADAVSNKFCVIHISPPPRTHTHHFHKMNMISGLVLNRTTKEIWTNSMFVFAAT